MRQISDFRRNRTNLTQGNSELKNEREIDMGLKSLKTTWGKDTWAEIVEFDEEYESDINKALDSWRPEKTEDAGTAGKVYAEKFQFDSQLSSPNTTLILNHAGALPIQNPIRNFNQDAAKIPRQF